MAITIKHVTRGIAGLHAESSNELHTAIEQLRTAGYRVDDVEDDADEPRYVAGVYYERPQEIRTIQQIVGAPGAYRNKKSYT